jgi:hypothetical protein
MFVLRPRDLLNFQMVRYAGMVMGGLLRSNLELTACSRFTRFLRLTILLCAVRKCLGVENHSLPVSFSFVGPYWRCCFVSGKGDPWLRWNGGIFFVS